MWITACFGINLQGRNLNLGELAQNALQRGEKSSFCKGKRQRIILCRIFSMHDSFLMAGLIVNFSTLL